MLTSHCHLNPSTTESAPGRVVPLLQGLVDRLTAPDLTASEAEHLRPRLLGLLAQIEAGAFASPSAAHAPIEAPAHGNLECCAAV
jgi:hypothetical protein